MIVFMTALDLLLGAFIILMARDRSETMSGVFVIGACIALHLVFGDAVADVTKQTDGVLSSAVTPASAGGEAPPTRSGQTVSDGEGSMVGCSRPPSEPGTPS